MTSSTIGWLFLRLAVIFVAAAIRDYRLRGGSRSPARRTWLRIAIIFGLIGAVLQCMRLV